MIERLYRSKIAWALILMIVVFLLGLLGYRFIYDYTWVEAFYMTIITVTTVGFSEVKPLDAGAKLFTSFLIVTSVFIFGFALSVISEYLLNRNSFNKLKQKKLKKKLNNLSGHVIVCGYGRNGMQVAERLRAYNKQFVVIENNEDIIERYEDNILFVKGDANEDEVLQMAGVEKASYLISAVPDDSDNLFVVLTARQLNEKLYIITRASQITSVKKLELAGANKVIMPDKIGGDHMASLIVMPDLITFINNLSVEGDNTTNLEEVEIQNFRSKLNCRSIRDLDLRNKTGCTIIGRPEQIKKLNHMFQIG